MHVERRRRLRRLGRRRRLPRRRRRGVRGLEGEGLATVGADRRGRVPAGRLRLVPGGPHFLLPGRRPAWIRGRQQRAAGEQLEEVAAAGVLQSGAHVCRRFGHVGVLEARGGSRAELQLCLEAALKSRPTGCHGPSPGRRGEVDGPAARRRPPDVERQNAKRIPNCTERGKPLPPRRLVRTRNVAGVRWSEAANVGLSQLVRLVRLKTSMKASSVRD